MPEKQSDIATVALVILATFAVIAALYVGAEFLTPIAFAVILSALFRPIIRRLCKRGIPAPLAGAVVVLGLAGGVVGLGYLFSMPVKAAVAHAPQTFDAAQERISRLLQPVRKITAAADKVEKVMGGAGAPASQPATAPASQPASQPASEPSSRLDVEPVPALAPPPPPPPQAAAPAAPEPPRVSTFATSILGTTRQVVGGVVEVLLLLYLLLASDRMFLKKLVRILEHKEDKQTADQAVHEAEAVVLRYLLVTACINLGQAAIITGILYWLGIPAPLLLGALTFLFEFIPYLGAAIMVSIITITALGGATELPHAMLAPAAYLLVTTLQNNLVSPYAYGKRLNLNPVAVLVGVLFWWYVWGIPGAFLAVPIMAMIRIVGDKSHRLKAIAEFLGE